MAVTITYYLFINELQPKLICITYSTGGHPSVDWE